VSSNRVLFVGFAAAVFAIASVILFGVAIGFDPLAGTELAQRVVGVEASDAGLIKWAALTDMLGYYLIPAMLIVMVRGRLTWTSSTSRDLATAGGLMYATIGAIGAAVLAAAAPPLIRAGTPEALHDLDTLMRMVQGLWQWLEALPFVVWAAGVALALRKEHPGYAGLFAVLGAGGVLVWIGAILGVDILLTAGLILWLAPFPVALATAERWSS
jgi:hypothetical protein